MKIPLIICFIIFLHSFQERLTAKNFKFLLSGEAGPYYSTSVSNEFLARLSGRIQYKYSKDRTHFLLKAKVTPELYGPQNPIQAIKIRSRIQLSKKGEIFTWQGHLHHQFHYYHIKEFNIYSQHLLFLGGKLNWPLSSSHLFGISLDYLYREIISRPANRLDSIIGKFGLNVDIGVYTRVAIDVYIERYLIKAQQIADEHRENSGYRFGPQLGLQHRSTFILNLTYHFLFISSELSSKTTLFHGIQCVWGKYLNRKWSLFFFINVLIQDILDSQIPDELTYLPLNNENWIYLKNGYDINLDTELFLKIGYTQDKIFREDITLSGWQLLLGFNYKF